ncbi:MAG TPA: hypothetical protein VE988_22000 [Gemmataceae bacterium]|nr:hypothetical protein [Gemmataceae bacterium]
MEMSVLIEAVNGNGYRARTVEHFGVSAEGATREEALSKLKAEVDCLLRNGAELVKLQVGTDSDPWLPYAGMFKDDPDFQEVKEIMAANRRQMDEDPEVP